MSFSSVFDPAQKKAADPPSTAALLDEWALENQIETNKGPDEIKADRTLEYYRAYLAAKNEKETAPINYENAKKRYLQSKYGDNYDTERKKEFKQEAEDDAVEFKKDHEKRVTLMGKAYDMYKGVLNVASSTEKDFIDRIEDHVERLKKERASAQFRATANRKTYYLNEEQETINGWDTFLTLWIVSVGIVHLRQNIIGKSQYKSVLAWTALLSLWLCSYILPMLVAWVIHLPKPVNVYTTWADTDTPEWHGQAIAN